EVRLRPVAADRLALALLEPQHIDDRAAGQKNEHQRRDKGAARAEGDVGKDVEKAEVSGEIGQPIEHRSNLTVSARARRPAETGVPARSQSPPFASPASPPPPPQHGRGWSRARPPPAPPRSRHSRPGGWREEPP